MLFFMLGFVGLEKPGVLVFPEASYWACTGVTAVNTTSF